jgi:protein disulfide-isomerase
MRTAAVCACAVLAVANAKWTFAEELSPVWRDDAYVAWKASQESGRPLLLFITSDNCPWCVWMERHTFADRAVQARLRASFVATRVEAAQQPELTRQLQIQAFPTTVVVGANNRVVAAIPGYLEPREFERRLAGLVK